MDLSQYFLLAPSDLQLLGREEEIQLLKIYAFNAYFNADTLRTDDVNNGCTYRRDNHQGIDGVFINETLEDNTIECLHSYFVGKGPFVLNEVLNAISRIINELDDVNKCRFVNNPEADNLLREYLGPAFSCKLNEINKDKGELVNINKKTKKKKKKFC